MIKIYSKKGCPFCEDAKAFLEKHKFNFTVVNIDQDKEAREFLIKEGHTTVPQIYVLDSVLVEGGYAGLKELSAHEIWTRVQKLIY